jgi:hypothetical protein
MLSDLPTVRVESWSLPPPKYSNVATAGTSGLQLGRELRLIEHLLPIVSCMSFTPALTGFLLL